MAVSIACCNMGGTRKLIDLMSMRLKLTQIKSYYIISLSYINFSVKKKQRERELFSGWEYVKIIGLTQKTVIPVSLTP